MAVTGFSYDPIFLRHDTGGSHVERPERLQAILNRLKSTGLMDHLHLLAPLPAERSVLELAHTPAYIDQVERDISHGAPFLTTDRSMDTRLSPDSLQAALMAVGAVTGAVDAVMSGQIQNAFCCVRPPGHHATRRAGMGFCIFNSVAIGALYARQTYGIQRSLIIDWDVHHGNGTQDILESDPGVFFASSHQWGIYPGTGSNREQGLGEAEGTVLNLPLPAHTSEEDFIRVWERLLPPAIESYRPEFVFISAGFDAHEDDLLGSLKMTAEGFARMTRLALFLAQTYADGRLVSALEGGYNLEALAESVESHVRELSGAASSHLGT